MAGFWVDRGGGDERGGETDGDDHAPRMIMMYIHVSDLPEASFYACSPPSTIGSSAYVFLDGG